MQKLKSLIKHRITHKRAVLVVNSVLQEIALAVAKRDHIFRNQRPYVQWFDEAVPEYSSAACCQPRSQHLRPAVGQRI